MHICDASILNICTNLFQQCAHNEALQKHINFSAKRIHTFDFPIQITSWGRQSYAHRQFAYMLANWQRRSNKANKSHRAQ